MYITYIVLLCIISVVVTMSDDINASIYVRIIMYVQCCYGLCSYICIRLFTYIFCSCVVCM